MRILEQLIDAMKKVIDSVVWHVVGENVWRRHSFAGSCGLCNGCSYMYADVATEDSTVALALAFAATAAALVDVLACAAPFRTT